MSKTQEKAIANRADSSELEKPVHSVLIAGVPAELTQRDLNSVACRGLVAEVRAMAKWTRYACAVEQGLLAMKDLRDSEIREVEMVLRSRGTLAKVEEPLAK